MTLRIARHFLEFVGVFAEFPVTDTIRLVIISAIGRWSDVSPQLGRSQPVFSQCCIQIERLWQPWLSLWAWDDYFNNDNINNNMIIWRSFGGLRRLNIWDLLLQKLKGVFTRFTCQLWHIGHFTFRLSLPQEFEQSLDICAQKKDIGRSGIRARYHRALNQPRYQWAMLARNRSMFFCISKKRFGKCW